MFEILFIIKTVLLVASAVTLLLSVILMVSPDLYIHIEEVLSKEVLHSYEMWTLFEGRIDIVNDFILENRVIFGTLFVLLSLYNIKSLFFLY